MLPTAIPIKSLLPRRYRGASSISVSRVSQEIGSCSWSCTFAIDVGVYNWPCLTAHIVHCRGHSSCADCVCITRCPANLNWVIWWVAEQQGNNCPDNPFVCCRGVQCVKWYKKWQCPYLPNDTIERKTASPLSNSGKEQQIDHGEQLAGNDKEIGLESIEAEPLET